MSHVVGHVISFDEWWKAFSGEARLPENRFINVAFKAGAQSRQVEVVLLQEQVDELQNRIDDVVKKLESIKTDDIRPHCYDYDKGWRDCAITVLSDLKGKENEN